MTIDGEFLPLLLIRWSTGWFFYLVDRSINELAASHVRAGPSHDPGPPPGKPRRHSPGLALCTAQRCRYYCGACQFRLDRRCSLQLRRFMYIVRREALLLLSDQKLEGRSGLNVQKLGLVAAERLHSATNHPVACMDYPGPASAAERACKIS